MNWRNRESKWQPLQWEKTCFLIVEEERKLKGNSSKTRTKSCTKKMLDYMVNEVKAGNGNEIQNKSVREVSGDEKSWS